MTRAILALVASLGAHGAAYAVAARAPVHATPPRPPSVVDFEVTVPEPRAADPEPPEPPRAAENRAPVSVAPKPAPKAPEPRPTAAAPVAEPVDLSGVTLTNLTGNGAFTVEAGNGQSTSAPIAIGAASAPAPAATSGGSRDSVPADVVVPVGDLSRRPAPPDLDAALRRHYPENARQLGIEGKAVVRARIAPGGHVERVAVMSSSRPDFGEACARTLRGTRWSPPLDRAGRPVRTEITYVCHFRVGG